MIKIIGGTFDLMLCGFTDALGRLRWEQISAF